MVKLSSAPGVDTSGLFDYIVKRQVTGVNSEPEKVPCRLVGELLKRLSSYMLNYLSREADSLTPYIIEGNSLQFDKQEFVATCQLAALQRKSNDQGDGIWSASMVYPIPGSSSEVRNEEFRFASTEEKRLKKLIKALPVLPYLWLKRMILFTGCSGSRSAVRTYFNKNNISHAHLNMPCEAAGAGKTPV